MGRGLAARRWATKQLADFVLIATDGTSVRVIDTRGALRGERADRLEEAVLRTGSASTRTAAKAAINACTFLGRKAAQQAIVVVLPAPKSIARYSHRPQHWLRTSSTVIEK